MAYATTNPFTGETTRSFPDATDAEINEALDAAHSAHLEWRKRSFAERSEPLERAAALLVERKEQFAGMLTLEMGKTVAEAQGEVQLSAEILQYYARNAGTMLAPRVLPVADASEGEATLVYEPIGIILAIEPWNFPYYQVARVIGPQLAAGNTVLLKHASSVPQSALALESLLREAGLPEGAFRNVFATKDQIERMVNDPRVQGVAFTGSDVTGAMIATIAAKALKKSTLELGGADAFIVLEDAELDGTAKAAVAGRHRNAGQSCVASKRMIVVGAVYDDFLAKYVEGIASLRAGDPADPQTTLAPLSSQKAADDLKEMVRQAIEHGAEAREVGAPVPNQGAFVQPTILTAVEEDNPAYHQEFFGPVTMLFRAKDEQDAIRIANDSPFGLGGSVFTADLARGRRVAEQVSTGMVFVNHATMTKADLPFGGIKRSGYGRELSDLGIKEFVNQKLIDINARS